MATHKAILSEKAPAVFLLVMELTKIDLKETSKRPKRDLKETYLGLK